MEAVLVMFKADGQTRSFPLSRDVMVIGRREDCDLRIPLTEVSRKHCRLVKDGEALRIEDLGSSNGTFQNGQRVQEAQLHAGDYLQIGPVLFAVQIDGVPASDAIHAPEPGQFQTSPGESASPQAATLAPAGDSSPLDGLEEIAPSGGGGRPATPVDAPDLGNLGDDLFVAADDAASDSDAGNDIVDMGDASNLQGGH